MRNESRKEILSQLREIADGYYRKTFETGEEVTWEGKLSIIAGVTPAIERYYAIHQVLAKDSFTTEFPKIIRGRWRQ